MVVGQADECSFATWTAAESGQLDENVTYYNEVVDALSDMLHRARS